MSDNQIFPVLRVTQLDTNELNESLLLTIKRSLNEDFFKYIQFKYIQHYRIELFAGLKFILWYNTYGKNDQTVGQSIFDWSYVFDRSNTKRVILLKKIIHAVIYCLDEWFEEKAFELLKKIIRFLFNKKKPSTNDNAAENSIFEKQFYKTIDIISRVYKSISFLNYITFLHNGKYLNLWERLLGMRPVYKNPQLMMQSSGATEASIREELWQTYFSLFRLSNSLFDFEKFYNKFIKSKLFNESQTVQVLDNEVSIKEIDLMHCGICKNEPIAAHRSKFENNKENVYCKHSFCYYCIKQEIGRAHV